MKCIHCKGPIDLVTLDGELLWMHSDFWSHRCWNPNTRTYDGPDAAPNELGVEDGIK